MDGDGVATAIAEEQYSLAKTSVWWDIENCHVPKGCDPNAIAQNISSALIQMNYCGPISISAYGDITGITASVQHALSSTGISLNHVPAGVKDASDKKILVDMLFWAVDNPAPANYLLISGDRDFSNALHQLRLRRYNILLAQPKKASAPLVAAAKSVWLWTSLLAGGPPRMNGGESLQLGNNDIQSSSDSIQSPDHSAFQTPHYVESNSEVHTGNEKFLVTCRQLDSGRHWRKSKKSNGPKVMDPAPVGLQENYGNINSSPPGNYTLNDPPSSPTPNCTRGNPDQMRVDNSNLQGNHQNPHSQPLRSNSFPLQPPFAPSNSCSPNFVSAAIVSHRAGGPNFSAAPLTKVPDTGNVSGYLSNAHDPHPVNHLNGDLNSSSYSNSPNPVKSIDEPDGHMIQDAHGPEHQPSSSATVGNNNLSGNGMWDILLAKPKKVSAPIVAAAKSVWLWTSHLAGGPPLMNGESLQLGANDIQSSSDSIQSPDHNAFQTPGNYTLNVPPSGSTPNFTVGNLDQMRVDNGNLQGNHQNPHSQPLRSNSFPLQPPFAPSSSFSPNFLSAATSVVLPKTGGPSFSAAPLTKVPDTDSISGYLSNAHDPHPVNHLNGDLNQSSYSNYSPNPVKSIDEPDGHMIQNAHLYNGHAHGPEHQPSSSATLGNNNLPGNGMWGSPESPKSSEYVQDLIGVVLLALNTLKTEKIKPTESNITDCIRFGDVKHRNTDVKKALEIAVEQQMVVKQNVGALQLFVGKNDQVWQCVCTMGGNPKKHSKKTWNKIKKFLATSPGRLAIMNTQCKYEAGLVIKNMCLKDHALGDVLQILSLAISYKKWIVHQQLGWQPVNINLQGNLIQRSQHAGKMKQSRKYISSQFD